MLSINKFFRLIALMVYFTFFSLSFNPVLLHSANSDTAKTEMKDMLVVDFVVSKSNGAVYAEIRNDKLLIERLK